VNCPTTLAAASAVLLAAFTPAAADIAVGAAGPMTGQYASFGEQMKRGAEMAVADLNAKGGVLGQKLKLVVGDDACDPNQAVAVANKMADDKVALVAGHFCSGASIRAAKVYAAENVVQISPASTTPEYTDKGGPNVFRVCGRDDQQGVIAGNFLADRFAGKKVAFLHDKTPYGKGLADETLSQFRKRGMSEAMYEAYTPGEKRYAALVARLKAAANDVVYIGGYHAEVGLIVRQAHEEGYRPQFVSGDALASKEFAAIAGKAGDGLLFSFSPDPRKNPAAAPLVKRFRDSGYDPEGYTLYTYAAVEVWAQAAEKARSVDARRVSEALRANGFDTVLGRIGFDRKGDVNAPGYVFYEWKGANYDYVKGQ
jgi:branched-chain amino acid transport system substrate-binding protein